MFWLHNSILSRTMRKFNAIKFIEVKRLNCNEQWYFIDIGNILLQGHLIFIKSSGARAKFLYY